jgi:hypothetical protein
MSLNEEFGAIPVYKTGCQESTRFLPLFYEALDRGEFMAS